MDYTALNEDICRIAESCYKKCTVLMNIWLLKGSCWDSLFSFYTDTEEHFNKSAQNEEVEEETSNDDNECEQCAFCNEVVDHSKHCLKTCSNCDFTTKCWAEDNKQWNETPDHNFSTAELREMGFKI